MLHQFQCFKIQKEFVISLVFGKANCVLKLSKKKVKKRENSMCSTVSLQSRWKGKVKKFSIVYVFNTVSNATSKQGSQRFRPDDTDVEDETRFDRDQ